MVYDPSAARSGAIASDNPTYRGGWICYINGIEVPITGWTVTGGVWQIPQFQIYCLPDPAIEDLGSEDRVQVAIFYLDQWVDPLHPEWRLLVDGEIIGRSMMHVSNQRVQSFTCLGNIQLFQQLYFFFMNTVDDIVAAQSPDIAAQGLTAPGLFYPYSLFHTGLFAPPQTGEEIQDTNNPSRRVTSTGADDTSTPADDPIKAPYELVYNVIKGIISKTDVPDTHRSVPMMNFFARHARKVRLHNRFVRLPLFEDVAALANRLGVFPIFNAARSDEALSAMQRQMAGQISNSGPVWNILQQTLGTVFMEIAMVPNPACVIVNLDGEIQGLLDATSPTTDQTLLPPPATTPASATTDTTSSPSAIPATITATQVYQQVFDRIVAAARALDPTFDASSLAIFQNGVNSGTVTGNPADFADRMVSAIVRGHEPLASLQDTANTIRQQIPGTATDEATRQNQAAQARTQNVTPAPAPPVSSSPAQLAAGPSALGIPTNTPVRLAQYFVKPQFMFGVAPLCNVIFPSLLGQWTDDENYINQPTRMYVNDSVMTRLMRASGTNRDWMLHALTVAYPEEADAILHFQQNEDSTSGTSGNGDSHGTGKDLLIWPEELYKGPVTARMELPSWFQMLMQTHNAGTGTDTGTGPGVPAPTTAPSTQTHSVATAPLTTAPQPTTPANQLTVAPVTTLPQFTPRGRPVGAQYVPGAWIPSGEIIDVANRVTGITNVQGFHVNDPAFARYVTQLGVRTYTTAPPNSRVIQCTDETQNLYRVYVPHSVYPGTARFLSLMRQMFPQIRLVYSSNRDPFSARPSDTVDMHRAGRCLDLMLEGHSPNHAAGDPIAEWLVNNAMTYGIQYFIWARTQFNASARGQRITPYTRPTAQFDHFDHVHVELDMASALGQMPWYLQAGPPPTQPATTAYAHPTSPPATPPAATRSTTPGPTPVSPPITIVTRPVNDPTFTNYTNEGGDAPTRDQPFQRLFRIYTQYEFFRQRYMQRNMAINTVFNPYIVAGFPCVLLDSLRTGSHRVGYVMGFQHTATAGENGQASWSTSITASCVRRFKEFLNDIRNDCERFAERVAAAPAEIIPEIRRIIQDDGRAELFYQKLFYGGARPGSIPAAFHFQDVLGFASGNETIPIVITGEDVDAASAIREAAMNAPPATVAGAAATPTTHIVTAAQVFQAAQQAATGGLNFTDPARLTAFRSAITAIASSNGSATPAQAQSLVFQAANQIFGTTSVTTPAVVADITEAVNLLLAGGVNTNPQMGGNASAGAASPTDPTTGLNASNAQTSRTGLLSVTHNLSDVNLPLQPLPGSAYLDAFDRADAALQLSARPACTLVQYIRFWHGGRTLGQCIADEVVEGEENDFAYIGVQEVDVNASGGTTPSTGPTIRQTATYWRRIYRFRQGPGTQPNASQLGYTLNPLGPSPHRAGLPADFPQTRADWETALLAYREKVRSLLSPGL